MEVELELAAFALHSDSFKVLLARANTLGASDEHWGLPIRQLESNRDLAESIEELLESLFEDARASCLLTEQLESHLFRHSDERSTLRIAYLALFKPNTEPSTPDVAWHPVSADTLADLHLASEEVEVVERGTSRIQTKFEYQPIATRLLDEPFTMGELRRLYEAIWGIALHPANFRRRVMSIPGFVRPSTEASSVDEPVPSKTTGSYLRGAARILHPALLRPDGPTNQDLLAPRSENED